MPVASAVTGANDTSSMVQDVDADPAALVAGAVKTIGANAPLADTEGSAWPVGAESPINAREAALNAPPRAVAPVGASVTDAIAAEALPLTDVLPEADAFGAAWVMLASSADLDADPEPVYPGAANVTRLGAADFTAEPVPDASGALAVIAAGAADREALPVPVDAGADITSDATTALVDPLTTVAPVAEPDGAVIDTEAGAAATPAPAKTLADGADIATDAATPAATPSLPACQNPATIAAAAGDSGRNV